MASDDNIVKFPSSKGEGGEQEILEVLECDNCANKTWQVSPEGILKCPICRTEFDYQAFLDAP